jgi:amino acid permease
MKKVKQILAIIGIILLVLLYLSTLICAIIDHTETMRLFQASILATVIIPVLLWAYSFIYKLIKKNAKDQMDEMQSNSNASLKDKANLSKNREHDETPS